ncbi:MAG: CotH kinase family protein [Verrucomicrobium sp.]|nr:CotH kinase family protein [Verrucomicrobium sp.]
MRPPRSRRRSLLMGHCALLLVAVCLAVEFWPTDGLQAYQDRSRPELRLGRDEITRRNAAFIRMGLLAMSSKFCPPEELAADTPAALALYGQPCPPPAAGRLQQNLPPSTALLPPASTPLPEGVVTISLVCRSVDLFHPDHGIVEHPLERGRESERPAWLTARQGGKILVESPVGLRIHGGHTRSTPDKSFSLVFREDYGGRPSSPAGLFFGPETPPMEHVILMNASHPSRFNSALATELAAQAGCHVSRSAPAVVYLNGTEIKAPFFVYEHQSPDFLSRRFGLRDAEWVRLKAQEKEDNEAYVEWRRWIRRPRNPIMMPEEAARFDLQALNSWVLAITFTGTGDNNQGAYFRDRSDPLAVWQTLTWDLDWAFDEVEHMIGGRAVNHSRRPFDGLLGDRGRLFHRLYENSAEYRSSYRQFAESKLGQELSREKVMAVVGKYEKLAREHPSSSPRLLEVMKRTRAYLERRHDEYFPLLDTHTAKVLQMNPAKPLAER